jgi:DNA-directed RNA polymerase specialized sigma24 family protein
MQAQEPRTPWMHAVEEAGHVQKARAGDRRALVALLRHYDLPLYRLAFALTRDVQAAVAIARTLALRARDGVRYMPEDIRFFPWAAQIVRKLAHSQPPAGAAASAAVGAAPRAEADVVELAARLLRTMAELDSNEQVALALRVVELLPDAPDRDPRCA